MDLGCVLSLSVWVVLISAVGAERGSIGAEVGCQCVGIPSVNRTKTSTQTCFKRDDRFRYECEEGYVRKAGTSNLIKCTCSKGGLQCSWTSPSLICIRDPKIPIKQPQSTSIPTTTPPVNLVKTTQKEETAKKEETTTTPPTTTKPPDIRTANTLISANLSSETKAGLSCALLVIVCALCGMVFWSYRRRSKLNIPPEIPEVQVPMNPTHRTADSGMDPPPADAADTLL